MNVSSVTILESSDAGSVIRPSHNRDDSIGSNNTTIVDASSTAHLLTFGKRNGKEYEPKRNSLPLNLRNYSEDQLDGEGLNAWMTVIGA